MKRFVLFCFVLFCFVLFYCGNSGVGVSSYMVTYEMCAANEKVCCCCSCFGGGGGGVDYSCFEGYGEECWGVFLYGDI